MATWVISMLKGGSRKSTTAMFLAFALARRHHDVLVIDADHGTQGVTDWSSKIYANGDDLPMDVAQWTPRLGLLVPFIQERRKASGATHVLVDIGGEAPEVLRQAILLANRVIAPVGPERGELARLPATESIVRSTDVPLSVLLTRVPVPGAGTARDARADLTADGYAVLTTEIEQNKDRFAHVWGTVPDDLGSYDRLTDELLRLEHS